MYALLDVEPLSFSMSPRLRQRTVAYPRWALNRTTSKACSSPIHPLFCPPPPPLLTPCPLPDLLRHRPRRGATRGPARRRPPSPPAIPTGSRPSARCGNGTRQCSTTALWPTSTFLSASRRTSRGARYILYLNYFSFFCLP
jgi:hypothetical protein